MGFSTRTRFSNYEKGNSKPGLDDLQAISKYFGVTTHQLLNEDLEKSSILASKVDEPKENYQKPNSLPLISIEAVAGYGQGDYSLPLGTEQYIIPEFNKKADFLIRISGTSMSPKYFNGDIVACKKIPTKTFLQWGKVYIMDTIQGVLCKRVLPSEKEGHIICRSDNSESYPDFELSWSEVRSLAIVVGSIRLE